MKITSSIQNNILTVCVNGRVDTTTSPELEEYIFERLDGISNLILDFKDMSYISSAGLRVLLKTQKTMNQKGSMKLINVSSDVMEIFEITGFSDILTIE